MQSVTQTTENYKSQPYYTQVRQLMREDKEDSHIRNILTLYDVPRDEMDGIIRDIRAEVTGEKSRKETEKAIANGTIWETPGYRHRGEDVKNGAQSQAKAEKEKKKAAPMPKDENGLSADSHIAVIDELERRAQPVVRYDAKAKQWYRFVGTHWDPDPAYVGVNQLYEEMVRSWHLQAANESDKQTREQYTELIQKYDDTYRRNSVIGHLRSRESIIVKEGYFNPPAHLVNFLNGVVDCQTKQLLPHDPDYRFAWVVPHEYNPEAKCPRFEQAIDEITATKAGILRPKIAAALRRWLGYCITGEITEQKFALLIGDGCNGKSTALVEPIAEILGSVAGLIQPEVLIASRNNSTGIEHLREVEAVKHCRFVYTGEPQDAEGSVFNTGIIKRFTDGFGIGRGIGRDRVQFPIQFKLNVMVNKRPSLSDTTTGTLRRFFPTPFERDYETDPTRDDRIKEKILSEAEGVLSMMIDEANKYYAEKIDYPEESKKYMKEYAESEEPLNDFFEDTYVLAKDESEKKDAFVRKSENYRKYKQWSKDNRQKKPLGKSEFNTKFEKLFTPHGVTEGMDSGNAVWRGIKTRSFGATLDTAE
jgi:putative DNA primase/helicase